MIDVHQIAALFAYSVAPRLAIDPDHLDWLAPLHTLPNGQDFVRYGHGGPIVPLFPREFRARCRVLCGYDLGRFKVLEPPLARGQKPAPPTPEQRACYYVGVDLARLPIPFDHSVDSHLWLDAPIRKSIALRADASVHSDLRVRVYKRRPTWRYSDCYQNPPPA